MSEESTAAAVEAFNLHLRELEEARRKVEAINAKYRPHFTRGILVLTQFQEAWIQECELEWFVPESFEEWGEVGAQGGSLFGIPYRVAAGIDDLYLAHKVKP